MMYAFVVELMYQKVLWFAKSVSRKVINLKTIKRNRVFIYPYSLYFVYANNTFLIIEGGLLMITENFIWPDSLLAKTTELKNDEGVILFGFRHNESIILKDMVILGSKDKRILPKMLIGGVLVGTAVMTYVTIRKVIKNKKK